MKRLGLGCRVQQGCVVAVLFVFLPRFCPSSRRRASRLDCDRSSTESKFQSKKAACSVPFCVFGTLQPVKPYPYILQPYQSLGQSESRQEKLYDRELGCCFVDVVSA